MNEKKNQVSINMFWPVLFIIFILCLFITPISEMVSFNYHRLAYIISGDSFYFPFWFYLFNEWIIIPLIFAFILLNIFFNINSHIGRIAKAITLVFIVLVLSLFGVLINYQDIRDVLNNNYITEKVSVYELEKTKRRGASKKNIMPHYRLTSYGTTRAGTLFCKLDIIGFRKITGHKNRIRQQFISENPNENVEGMSPYEFDTYIDSYRGYKFGKWQELNDITIFYLPDSRFIFRYESVSESAEHIRFPE